MAGKLKAAALIAGLALFGGMIYGNYGDKPVAKTGGMQLAGTPFTESLENLQARNTYDEQSDDLNPVKQGSGEEIKSQPAPVEEEAPSAATAADAGKPGESGSIAGKGGAPSASHDSGTVSRGNTPVVNRTDDPPAPPSRSGSLTQYNKLSPSKGIYGQFRYREIGGGRIEIDPQWVAQNLVTITLPGLDRQVQVNRAAKDKFLKAFTYIKNGTATINGKQVPLLSLIKSMDGTFVSRHVNWNPANGLSNHSWGTAIDINASNHFIYVDPLLNPNDPNLILWEKAFKPAGFSWGNSYSDAMHYELLNG